MARKWGVEIEGPLPGATCSLVLAARGEPPLLSVGEGAGGEGPSFVLRMPLLEWEREASLRALRAFAPHGGVAVLQEDPATGAVLLPRLRSGLPLDTLPEDDAIEVWLGVVRRLRGAQGEAPSIEAYLDGFWLRPTDLRLAIDVPALVLRLLDTRLEPRLLHGDLHHYNVLRHGEAWVAIDPEGVTGDPAYECAAFLRNPVPALGREPDLSDLLRKRILRLAEALGEPAERIWGWALVRTALCVWDDLGAFEGAWLKVVQALDGLNEEFGCHG